MHTDWRYSIFNMHSDYAEPSVLRSFRYVNNVPRCFAEDSQCSFPVWVWRHKSLFLKICSRPCREISHCGLGYLCYCISLKSLKRLLYHIIPSFSRRVANGLWFFLGYRASKSLMFVESWKEVESEAKRFSKHAVLLGHIRGPLGLVKKSWVFFGTLKLWILKLI